MKQDRFLQWILLGIVILVGIALVLFFSRHSSALDYQSEDSPRGVVFDYLLALDKGDYDKAYGYISDFTGKPTIVQFRQSMAMNKSQFQTTAIDIVDQSIVGQTGTVTLKTTMGGGGPFNQGYSTTENATLENVNGKWSILSMPSQFWSYEWNQPVIK